jgi:hypothetical protein
MSTKKKKTKPAIDKTYYVCWDTQGGGFAHDGEFAFNEEELKSAILQTWENNGDSDYEDEEDNIDESVCIFELSNLKPSQVVGKELKEKQDTQRLLETFENSLDKDQLKIFNKLVEISKSKGV